MSVPTTPGWVHVLRSGCDERVCKIGRSTRNAGTRARELDASLGYAGFGPWTEVGSRAVSDCAHVEAAAHQVLAHRRIKLGRSPCRELFRVDAREACRVVEAAAGSLRRRPASFPSRTFRHPRRLWRGRAARRVLGAALILLALLWFLNDHGYALLLP